MHSMRPNLGRLFAAALAMPAFLALVLLATPLAGLRLDGPSAWWQGAVALGCLAAVGAGLMHGTPAPWRARVGQLENRRSPSRLGRLLPAVAALALAALWLQPWPTGPAPSHRLVAVVRLDPIRPGAGAQRGLWLAGEKKLLDEAKFPEGVAFAPEQVETERVAIAGTEAFAPGMLAFRTGTSPVVLPPGSLTVQPGLGPARLGAVARWAGSDSLVEDPAGIPMAAAVLKFAPSPPSPEGESVSSTGSRVLVSGAARLTGQADLGHYWLGLPTRPGQERLLGLAVPEAYPLVCEVRERQSEWLWPLEPVVATGWEAGESHPYLCSLTPSVPGGFDSLGEAGQAQPAALLDGAVRTWRSRRAAAPGAWMVLADSTTRVHPDWYAPLTARNPAASLGEEAHRRCSAGRVILVAATLTLLAGVVAQGVRRRGIYG